MGIRTVLVIASLVICRISAADTPQNITRGEIALLPPYCPDAQTFGLQGFREGPHPRQRPWIAQMGDTFWAIHHYCWALVSANRAKRAGITAQQRQGLYQAALNDCYYVLEHANEGFVLLPEIYLRMGQFAVGVGDPVRAIEYFGKSREAKADYWPAYQELAKVNISIGRRAAAVNVLKEGLVAVPEQPDLADMLRSLSDTKGTRKPAVQP